MKTDNLTDNERVTAETAEAENGNNAASVLGKFKDVQTLMQAYTDLEAEFTRRSQRLKELEKGNKAAPASDGTKATPSRSSEEELIETALSNEKVREAVIGEYLKGIASAKEVPLISGGGAIPAPRFPRIFGSFRQSFKRGNGRAYFERAAEFPANAFRRRLGQTFYRY